MQSHFKKWRQSNREKDLKRCKAYYRANKKRLQSSARERYHANGKKKKRKVYAKDLLRRGSYAKKRERVDRSFKLLRRLRYRLWKATNGKGGGALKLLGCTLPFFQSYIESRFEPGMTWENYGVHGWHIDHDKQCASFDLTHPIQRGMCFHWSNLKPMWGKENCSKGSRS